MAILMTPPEGARKFLATTGWDGADIVPLAGDASFRRYFRVTSDAQRAVLMDAPPPHEDPRPFIAVAEWLTSVGFQAPHILAHDLNQGLVLIEDFGDSRMREAIDAHPDSERELYRDVVTLLAQLHREPAMTLPAYDRNAYQREVGLFTQYYSPAVGLTVDEAGFLAAWDDVLLQVSNDSCAAVTVLRDYHAENIMLIENKSGIDRLGLLDFQDALAGHPAYDLVSMLQDARRDVAASIEEEMMAYYLSIAPASAGFGDIYHILGAQRNTKILGIFTRLWKRDNKPHYLAFQPRVWRYLERDLAHPALAPVKHWFDVNIPIAARAAAWSAYAG